MATVTPKKCAPRERITVRAIAYWINRYPENPINNQAFLRLVQQRVDEINRYTLPGGEVDFELDWPKDKNGNPCPQNEVNLFDIYRNTALRKLLSEGDIFPPSDIERIEEISWLVLDKKTKKRYGLKHEHDTHYASFALSRWELVPKEKRREVRSASWFDLGGGLPIEGQLRIVDKNLLPLFLEMQDTKYRQKLLVRGARKVMLERASADLAMAVRRLGVVPFTPKKRA